MVCEITIDRQTRTRNVDSQSTTTLVPVDTHPVKLISRYRFFYMNTKVIIEERK